MYFRQILHSDLGCASYLLADRGEAVVVDPKWEVEQYVQAAEEAGARIRYVLETHHHADHVSGRARLSCLTGASTLLPTGPGQLGISAGEVVRIGDIELLALGAPGHRPEHLAYLACRDGLPRMLLSGDSLLVGDVARPDLAVAAEDGARALWHTLQRLCALPEDVELWPAHVGGSLCASQSASSETSSTIGQERLTNPLLAVGDVEAFTAEITRCTPARPPTVERVVALNRRGAQHPGPVGELDAADLAQVLAAGMCVLDLRDPDSFDSGHVEGSINLPLLGRGLGTRAGWAAGQEESIELIVPSLEEGRRATELLRAAGVWNLAGMSVADPIAWWAAGLRVHSSDAVAPDGLAARVRAGEVTLVDVRDPAEWSGGHIPGSQSLPLSVLGDGRAAAESLQAPIAVVCASGVRAAVAASILRRHTRQPVTRVSGGVDQMAQLGLSLVEGSS
ncbi:MAG: rhodanese-like domain-containing protein [Solirubrobacteraceae bacterium]